MQVAKAVSRGAGNDVGSLPGALHVSDATSCARGGAAEWSHTYSPFSVNGLQASKKTHKETNVCVVLTRWEVVRLCGEDDVSQRAPDAISAGLGRILRADALQLHSSDCAGRTHDRLSPTEQKHAAQGCCWPHLLLSQNLMTLFWLLCLWVSIIRLKRVSFCSCPSITARPRKNQ